MSSTPDLLSIGNIARRRGRPVRQCLARFAELGKTPHVTLNGVAYYAAADALLIDAAPGRFVDARRDPEHAGAGSRKGERF